MSNLKDTFKDNPERAREAGKKSKRGISRKASLARMLEMDAPKDFLEQVESKLGKLPGRTMADLLSAVIIAEAAKGNIQAHKEINDRLDGKPQQAIELSGDQDKPVLIINRFDGNKHK